MATENGHKEAINFLIEFRFSEPAQNIMPEAKTSIWIGRKEASYPIWCGDRGFGGVLSILDGEKRAKKSFWLDDEEDIWYLGLPVNQKELYISKRKNGDGDWDILLKFLKRGLDFVDKCLEADRSILIQDDDGISFSYALLCVWLVTRKKVRVKEAIEYVVAIRRECKLSVGLERGLRQFQDMRDEKKLQRLEARLKSSDVISMGF